MIPLSRDSARLVGAQRFGVRLREAMKRNGVGQVRLSAAVGVSASSIGNYRMGHNVPTIEVAQRLADVLGDAQLVMLAVQARNITCETCARVVPVEAGSPRRFCTEECRRVAGKKVAGPPASTRARAITAERSLSVHRDAVALMCRQCEPSGLCRTASCPLRIVSPYPLTARGDYQTSAIPDRRKPDPTALRAALQRRWTDEARKELSARMRDRFASMSDEERAAFAAKVSASRRKSAA